MVRHGRMLNREQIQALIPHRPPFLLVDEVHAYVLDDCISGIKRITAQDPVFQGHFPGEAVYPGVLITEALGQLTAVLLKLGERYRDRLILFGGINHMRFLEPVRPEAVLELESRLVRQTDTAAVSEVSARVGGRIVVKGELITGSVLRREPPA